MFHFSYICGIVLMILVSTLANQIIFEQVGEMASSVTYLHVKFEVDIQDIEDQVNEYLQIFPRLKTVFEPLYQKQHRNISTQESYYRWENLKTVEARKAELDKALAHRQRHAERFLDSIKSLRSTLPKVTVDKSTIRVRRETEKKETSMVLKFGQKAASSVTSNLFSKLLLQITPSTANQAQKVAIQQTAKKALTSFIIKQGTGSLLGVGLGALGTFMGLFNTFQIHSLKRELEEQREAHNRLVDVVQEQQDHLQQLDEAVEKLSNNFELLRSSTTMLLGNELGIIEEQIAERIRKVTHVIQLAQTRRLAIDFLPVEYLPRLYQQLEDQAKAINHKLLTKQQSDLFQLEMSYFYDGMNMQLLLHVPTVPIDSILRLLKLHPFPLPLNKNYSVIPLAQDDLLAISSGFTRYSSQLSSVDLLGCHEINNVYLCERHGVLGKQLNNSCLGAMYLQDFELVQELCTLQITPALEVVRQLQDNWFLVFTPYPQTAYISCRNGTNNEAYFKSGISKTYLSPGCKMNLDAHLLQSDFSLQLPDEVVNFQWDWDVNPIIETLEKDMEILKEAGNVKPTLKDVRNLKITRAKSILSRIFIISITSLVALATVAVLVIWCFFRDLLFKVPCIKRKIKRIKKHPTRRNRPPTSGNLLDLSPPEGGSPLYLQLSSWEQRCVSPPVPVQQLYPSLPQPITTPRLTWARSRIQEPLPQTYATTILSPAQPIYSEIPIPPVRRITVHREM
jgi:hypothetical protein